MQWYDYADQSESVCAKLIQVYSVENKSVKVWLKAKVIMQYVHLHFTHVFTLQQLFFINIMKGRNLCMHKKCIIHVMTVYKVEYSCFCDDLYMNIYDDKNLG